MENAYQEVHKLINLFPLTLYILLLEHIQRHASKVVSYHQSTRKSYFHRFTHLCAVKLEKGPINFFTTQVNKNIKKTFWMYMSHFSSKHEYERLNTWKQEGIYIKKKKKNHRKNKEKKRWMMCIDSFTCDNPWRQGGYDRTLSLTHSTERSEEKSVSGHGKENSRHREHRSKQAVRKSSNYSSVII